MSREEDLLRLNAELREAIDARDEFLTIAAHELRNPMHALSLQVLTALDAAHRVGDPDLIKRLERVHCVLDRYVKQATMLLDTSRVNAGRLQLHFEKVDLVEVITEVTESCRLEAGFHRSSFNVVAPEALQGRWDRMAVEQIVTNLVSNAIKYGDGQPIHLIVDPHGAAARLRVRDAGGGIAPEDQARIFGRFEQVVTEHRHTGFGIGLWLVRRLIEAHRGSIEVDSTPGEGSTFTVLLPLDASQYEDMS